MQRFFVTLEEWKIIEQKMKLANMVNFSEYARQMVMKGYVIEVDYSAVKALTKEIGYIGRSINQIAKRVNATGNAYQEDISEIKEYMKKIWHIQRSTLLSQR